MSDARFEAFQQRLLLKFATQFDTWAERATNPLPDGEVPRITLGDFARGTIPIDTATLSARGALIWDLGLICRDFVTGDAWSWAFYRRRLGESAEAVARDLPARVAEIEAQTYRRKWKAGLGLLSHGGRSPYNPFDDESPDQAWRAAVEESVPEFIGEYLIPALSKSFDSSDSERLRTVARANRKKIEKFKKKISAEAGQRITLTDIAYLARYKTTTEIKRFQRNDRRLAGTADTNIRRALRLTATEAWAQIQKHRQRHSDRRE